MLQSLGIKFIVHLGQLRAFGGGQLAGGAIQGAGVVLYAQEVISLKIGQVVGELLLPRGVRKGFPARLGLQVVEGERQPHLHMRADGPDGFPGGGVGTHDKNVSFGGTFADKDFGLGVTEYTSVFCGGIFHVLHHLLEIHTHLYGALGGFARGGSGFGRLFGHQSEPLGDGCQLQSHVGFVDGAHDVQLAAQLFHHIGHIPLEIGDGGLGFPATFGDQPFGTGEMQQGHHRFHPVGLAAGEDLAVVLHLSSIKPAFLRFNSCPLDGKTVGVEPGFGQKSNVLLISGIMVAGDAAGLGKAGVGQLFLGPVVRIDIVAFHLVGRSGGAYQKIFCKFLHG